MRNVYVLSQPDYSWLNLASQYLSLKRNLSLPLNVLNVKINAKTFLASSGQYYKVWKDAIIKLWMYKFLRYTVYLQDPKADERLVKTANKWIGVLNKFFRIQDGSDVKRCLKKGTVEKCVSIRDANALNKELKKNRWDKLIDKVGWIVNNISSDRIHIYDSVITDIVSYTISPTDMKHLNFALLAGAGSGKSFLTNILAELLEFGGLLLDNDGKVTDVTKDMVIRDEAYATTLGYLYENMENVIRFDEVYGFFDCKVKRETRCIEFSKQSQEFADAVVWFLTEFKGLISVMVAGYPELTNNTFFASNEGLRRRFPNFIVLDLSIPEGLEKVLLFQVRGLAQFTPNALELFRDTYDQHPALFISQSGDVENMKNIVLRYMAQKNLPKNSVIGICGMRAILHDFATAKGMWLMTDPIVCDPEEKNVVSADEKSRYVVPVNVKRSMILAGIVVALVLAGYKYRKPLKEKTVKLYRALEAKIRKLRGKRAQEAAELSGQLNSPARLTELVDVASGSAHRRHIRAKRRRRRDRSRIRGERN
jgi:hypothetical protein